MIDQSILRACKASTVVIGCSIHIIQSLVKKLVEGAMPFFKGPDAGRVKLLTQLYILHQLERNFDKECKKEGYTPEEIEEYLEEVIK